MAVTRLRKIKETAGKNMAVHLKKNIFYICQMQKTGGGFYIGGNAGISPQIIYRTMLQNKEYWQKTDKTQGYHYMLCFPPDCKVNEETAYQIAKEFCEALLGDDFYYVFAVHNDRPHMHAHITFDSVSKKDGHKFHSPKGDWERRIQPITDQICRKYQLPTLDYKEKERTGVHYGEWKKRCELKETSYSWNDIIRDDIDEAILHADSFESFVRYLIGQRYSIRNGTYLSLKPYGRQKAIRSGRLGAGYTKEEIIQRIADKKIGPDLRLRYQTYGNREEVRQIIFAKVQRVPGWKMNAMQRQFYQRWNRTFFIRKPGRYRQAWKYKKDILEVQSLADALNYLIHYDIQNEGMLLLRKENVDAEIQALILERQRLQARLRRKDTDMDAKKEVLVQCKKMIGDAKRERQLIIKTLDLFYQNESLLQDVEERKRAAVKYDLEEWEGRTYGKEKSIDQNPLGERSR